MKILIELPNWLGDAIMATPAIENLAGHFSDAAFTLIGSEISIEAIKGHPKVIKTYVLDKTYISLYKKSKELGEFDMFFSFRSSFRSKFMKFFVLANSKFQFDKNKFVKGHQVEKFNNFINQSININSDPGKLILHNGYSINKRRKKVLGINPGASYGDAKRWYPDEFAKVCSVLSEEYDIVIFGGINEKKTAFEIENTLKEKGIRNFQNIAAKTTVSELIRHIASLDMFITGDTGPMHIAAAFQIPTVSIFGPTRDYETSQWSNENGLIVKKNLECQPCMKRSCPLNHHNCMKLIQAADVLKAVNSLNY